MLDTSSLSRLHLRLRWIRRTVVVTNVLSVLVELKLCVLLAESERVSWKLGARTVLD
jgi:hypothetical protein